MTLREPVNADVDALVDLLSLADASGFGVEEPITPSRVAGLIERAAGDRAAGLAFTYAIILNASRDLVGLVQIRQLDPMFQAAECDCTIAREARGGGVFLEAARLSGSLAFDEIGTHRLEARVLLQHGRSNGALRKLGAVQEGVLRRAVRRHGEYCDQVLWSILKDDWGQHRVAVGSRIH